MSSHSSVPQVDRDLEAQERAQEPSAEYHGRWHVALHPSVKKNTPRGALPFLHPTHATLTSSTGDKLRWTSRDHRKNRHVVSNPRSGQPRQAKDDGMWTKFARMRRVEYWNISWWVAMAFTSGSIVWVINGFIVFLPFVNSHVGKDMVGGGWSAWIGATIFEFGGILAMWEAWNRGDSSDFGWGVDQMLQTADLKRPGSLRSDHGEPPMPEKKRWIWFSLEGKYFHEIGFLAAFVQYWAATIFWISGFTGLPAIQDAITSNTGLLDGVYWTPQVIGGTGFIISSTLLMIEAQKKWYRPAPSSLGWQIGFWNLVGGVGFTLCGALGYGQNSSTKLAYQSSCSTFWGGWAFLIGSLIQWYEAVNPV